jgi:mannose-6-phosphate isomerase-like protein (cupin superfamily)
MKSINKNKFAIGKLEDFQKFSGYFIGQFMGENGFPILETNEVEIAYKKLPEKFEKEKPHYHKKGVEINIVIKGKYKAQVNEKTVVISEKEFLVVYPQAKLKNISAQKGTELIVVKAPSVPDDKFRV